jgi:Tfp pilus assembly protein PilV
MRPSSFASKRAFSLIEVVLALGICSFCLIALLGLLTQGLSSNRDTVSQTQAAAIARMVQSDLAVRPIGTDGRPQNTSNLYTIQATAGVKKTFFVRADGTIAPSAQDADFRVDVSLGGGAGGTTSTMQAIPVYILVTWPAAANPSGTVSKPVSSFEAVTAIPGPEI